MTIRFVTLAVISALFLSAGTPPLLADSSNAMDFLNELKGLYLDNPSPSPSAPTHEKSAPGSGRTINPSIRSETNRSPQGAAGGTRHPTVDQSMLATTFSIPYGKSRLVVETANVRFATVLIDGIIIGMTPVAVDLPDGRGQVTVEIRKTGYRPAREAVHLLPGHTEKWIARLHPLPDEGP